MTGKLTYDGTQPSGIEDARLGPLLDRKGGRSAASATVI